MKSNTTIPLGLRIGSGLVTGFWLLLMIAGSVAETRAESTAAFIDRIRAAYRAPDRPTAIKGLFNFSGVDAETVQHYEKRIIGRMLGKYHDPKVTLEPLPGYFVPVQVIGPYEYRPNLKPLGYVVLNGRTKVPYGERQGRYYLTAVTRTRIQPAPPPDKMLQMMVIGLGHPPVRFTGHCDIMQGNGRVRRMPLEDAGHGGNTAIITAQYIAACRVVNRSGRGALSLRLQEGETVTFHERAEAPDLTITYRRGATAR